MKERKRAAMIRMACISKERESVRSGRWAGISESKRAVWHENIEDALALPRCTRSAFRTRAHASPPVVAYSAAAAVVVVNMVGQTGDSGEENLGMVERALSRSMDLRISSVLTWHQYGGDARQNGNHPVVYSTGSNGAAGAKRKRA